MNAVVSRIRHALEGYYPSEEIKNLSKLICCEMLGQSAVDYYLGKDIILSENDEQSFENILFRLRKNEPIQYIQGIARFYGRSFRVFPGVLIPRPETEELVEYMLAELSSDSSLLDIGTGSGCIAVTLAKELPHSRVAAWDISEDALRIARINSEALGAKITFKQCNVFAYTPEMHHNFDAIVSNPPYVTEAESKDMEPNVLNWEPHTALFVPDNDPLIFYRRIGCLGMQMLKEGGQLYFEINRAFGIEMLNLLMDMGYHNVRLLKDISGNDRFIIAKR
ncbi:peptide chain release factor N(5)-glutamine methyltransferase [Bacteroidaceae bacterium HV4-6-C5C]|nr:peptide chain release factor N(5)-glutamine methyltransferase [Bacteroidaceae bacterium HV4-6-C5C]